MFIDYDKLVKDYNKSLNDNLRGFKGGPGFLETWTYDEDFNRSVMGIVDHAIEYGHEAIMIVTKDERANNFQLGGYKNGILSLENGRILYFSERVLKLRNALNEAAGSLGITTEIIVAGIKGNVVTIDYDNDPNLHLSLIKIERLVQEMTREKIDIQTLNIDDKNRRTTRERT